MSRLLRKYDLHQMDFLYLISLLSSCILMFLIVVNINIDADMFWHVKDGEAIINAGGFIYSDKFSWLRDTYILNTTTQEWLFDVLAYLIISCLTFKYVYVITGIVHILIFLSVVYVITKITKCRFIALLLALLFGFCVTTSMLLRPQLITYIMIIWVAYSASKRNLKLVYLLLFVEVNLHAGTAPVFIGICGYYYFRYLFHSKLDFSCISAYKVIFVNALYYMLIPFLVTLLNPSTYLIYTYTLRTLSSTDTHYIKEWASLSVTDNVVWTSLCILLLIGFVYTGSRKKKSNIFTLDICTCILLCLYSALSIRNAPVVALCTAVLFADYFKKSLLLIGMYLRHLRPSGAIYKLDTLKYSVYTFITLVLVLFMSYAQPYKFYTFKNTETTPVDAATFIKDNKLTNVMNYYNCGGYFIYLDIPVFVDGRQDLYTSILNDNTIFKDFISAFSELNVSNVVKKYNANYILVPNNYNLKLYLDADSTKFDKIYSDAVTSIYKVST